jgi:hypothetical protein
MFNSTTSVPGAITAPAPGWSLPPAGITDHEHHDREISRASAAGLPVADRAPFFHDSPAFRVHGSLSRAPSLEQCGRSDDDA